MRGRHLCQSKSKSPSEKLKGKFQKTVKSEDCFALQGFYFCLLPTKKLILLCVVQRTLLYPALLVVFLLPHFPIMEYDTYVWNCIDSELLCSICLSGCYGQVEHIEFIRNPKQTFFVVWHDLKISLLKVIMDYMNILFANKLGADYQLFLQIFQTITIKYTCFFFLNNNNKKQTNKQKMALSSWSSGALPEAWVFEGILFLLQTESI